MARTFDSVCVVGAGAVGSFFGAMLARAGNRVTLIGRPAHVQAIQNNGLRLDMGGRVEAIRVAAKTGLEAANDASLVLFCVKSPDTAGVARELAPHLADDALILSLQNGVENAQTIARHVARTVVPAVVYVATSLPEPGVVRHFGRGDLTIGPLDANAASDPATTNMLEALVDLFAKAQVPVRITNDVTAQLWLKLLTNCAYNAISAIAQAPYGELVRVAEIRELQRAVVQEVVAVAIAAGVALSLDAALEATKDIVKTMPGQRSSTAQDVARHRPTEIDHLNGFIARRGRELGIDTPANQALHALVKLVESRYDGAERRAG
jgi:2-dehydropantoate 2-reductase